ACCLSTILGVGLRGGGPLILFTPRHVEEIKAGAKTQTSIEEKLFIGRDTTPPGGEYITNIGMIFGVSQPGEALAFVEISERVRARFGDTSEKSLRNALDRAVRRGEFQKIQVRGPANTYRRSSST
ncbi:MAG: hypothetical protein J5I35_07550, partial [Methanothrix harundinacea]|nr:hypothetical protein [Methanothrix harundinacea]